MPSPLPPGERYSSLAVVTSSLGSGFEIVSPEDTKAAQLMSAQDADILLACRPFRTLEDHARHVCREAGMSPEHVAPVREQIEGFARDGLLLPHAALLDRCRRASPAPAASPVSCIGVVTRDRPAALERCLASVLENARAHGRSVRVVVADDSPSPSSRDPLVSLRSRFGVRLSLADRDSKRGFREALARSGVGPPELLDFALGDPEGVGFAPGANRNALLLETVGEAYLSFDDDVVCRLAAPPEAGPGGLALASTLDPTEAWFYPDRESALAAARPVEADLVAAHSAFLGREAGACVTEAAGRGPVAFDAMDLRFLRSLRKPARVRVTQGGLAGDCALGSPSWVLALGGRSRERLLQSEDSYRVAVSSREVARSVTIPTLSNSPFLMTYAAGFDNTGLLPPFMPVARYEDGIFGLTLVKCFDDALLAHLPLLVLHAPVEPRAFKPEDVWSRSGVQNTNDFVVACMASFEIPPSKPAGAPRLRLLGTHLVELASMPAADFREFVVRVLWHQSSWRTEALLRELQRSGASAPSAWRADLHRTLEGLRQAMPREDFAVPRDLLRGRSPEEAWKLAQKLVLRFGGLLRAWPDIAEAARALAAKGVSPAREL